MKANKRIECTHYWEIKTASGAVSDGTCKYCGETKLFTNSIYRNTRHITLEREHAPETKASKQWPEY